MAVKQGQVLGEESKEKLVLGARTTRFESFHHHMTLYDLGPTLILKEPPLVDLCLTWKLGITDVHCTS